jgi:hypothetical protein
MLAKMMRYNWWLLGADNVMDRQLKHESRRKAFAEQWTKGRVSAKYYIVRRRTNSWRTKNLESNKLVVELYKLSPRFSHIE